jgi:hypothetical protein
MADCKIVYYNSTTSSIELGDFLYQNQAQTIPAAAGFYAWTVNDKWFETDSEGVIISSGSCSQIGQIWTPTLIGSVMMGCISSSLVAPDRNQITWKDAYYTSSFSGSNPGYFVTFAGTGSISSSSPSTLLTTTASFQAYDFNRTYFTQEGGTIITYPQIIYNGGKWRYYYIF